MTSCPTWVDNVLFVSWKSRMGVAAVVLVSIVSPYLHITAWQFACESTKTTRALFRLFNDQLADRGCHALFQLSVDKGSGHWLRSWIIQVPLTFKPEIVTKGAFLLTQMVMNSDFWGKADRSVEQEQRWRLSSFILLFFSSLFTRQYYKTENVFRVVSSWCSPAQPFVLYWLHCYTASQLKENQHQALYVFMLQL